MAEMTLTEAQLQLSQVNIAIENLLSGKRVSRLTLGSGEFAITKSFNEITLESLREYRIELRNYITQIEPVALPIFRTNACIPIIVLKGVI
jgi:hypothetical protein